jgi:hypothetical protein
LSIIVHIDCRHAAMSATKKFCLITRGDLERLTSEKHSVRDKAEADSVVERRERAVNRALVDVSRPPDVRMKILDQVIQEYTKARRDAEKKVAPLAEMTPVAPAPPAPPSLPPPPSPSPSETSYTSSSVETPASPSPTLAPLLPLNTIAGKLLAWLQRRDPPVIRWTADGVLLDEYGQEVLGTSAIELAIFTTEKRMRKLPTGWNVFASALVRGGAPADEIPNSTMRRAMDHIIKQEIAEKSFQSRPRNTSSSPKHSKAKRARRD